MNAISYSIRYRDIYGDLHHLQSHFNISQTMRDLEILAGCYHNLVVTNDITGGIIYETCEYPPLPILKKPVKANWLKEGF